MFTGTIYTYQITLYAYVIYYLMYGILSVSVTVNLELIALYSRNKEWEFIR